MDPYLLNLHFVLFQEEPRNKTLRFNNYKLLKIVDYTTILQRSYSQLVNYISCTKDIAARLFQNQMMTLPELDSVQKARTMGKANENLLRMLLRKPIKVYHAFLAELQRTHQSHVLSMLANTGESLKIEQLIETVQRRATIVGARWGSGINAANGARGPRFASRILPTVQRPWTSR